MKYQVSANSVRKSVKSDKPNQKDIDELWENYGRDKSITNRNKIIEHYLYLLYKPVKSIYPICRNTNEMEDIFQSAVIGLTEAVEYYSRDKNASFQTFSRWRIHGSIIDYLRKSSLISLPYNARKKINADREKYELANIDFTSPYQITSLDAIEESFEGSGGGFISNLQTDISELTENQVENKILLENIYRVLTTLPCDEYIAVVHYYFFNKTLDEIAYKLKMTRSGVWQIKNRAINRIRKMII